MKRGVIVNPKSGRSGKGLALARMIEASPSVMLRLLDDFASLPRILDEMAAQHVSELFVSSGDGTVHAVQTDLAERRPFPTLPELALLPHGTTNMTAADLGLSARTVAAQAAFIAGQPASLRKPRQGAGSQATFLVDAYSLSFRFFIISRTFPACSTIGHGSRT